MDDVPIKELKAFVDAQVSEGGYASAREYVDLMMRREREITRVRALLIEGRDSGPAEPVDEAFWENLRDRIRRHERKSA